MCQKNPEDPIRSRLIDENLNKSQLIEQKQQQLSKNFVLIEKSLDKFFFVLVGNDENNPVLIDSNNEDEFTSSEISEDDEEEEEENNFEEG